MKYFSLLFVFFSSTLSANVSKSFTVTTTIDDSKFNSSYQILGKDGYPLNQGVLSFSQSNYLDSIVGVPFTFWEVFPDGKSKRKISSYQLKLTQIKASYFGETEEKINIEKLNIMLDDNVVIVNSSINVNVLDKGYNELKVKSNSPIEPRKNKNNDRIRVSVVGIFENIIE